MAGSRRAQDIDQWRPEEPSLRDTQRDGPRERLRDGIDDPRPSSPARAARDSSRRRTNDTDTRPSTKNPRGRSRERSPSRDRTRRRSREASRDEPPPPPPSSPRYDAAPKAPAHSLSISERFLQTIEAPPQPQLSTLQITGPPRRFNASTFLYTPFFIPSPLAVGRFALQASFTSVSQAVSFIQKDGRDVTSPCGGHHPEGIAIDEALRRDDREKDRTCPTLLDQRKEVAAVPLAPQGLALQPSGVLHSQLDVALHFTRDEA
ncbi:hypothetical protein SNOG_11254 [Parastagonospora nodorum SN15]|uniref:Uncharacterized protein n=1 Tax=Phaeosphaeria nodorum (strain SN15 / ATCC MYA-4574 / FGSC 10173) TaxID=321614 RepID=Q0UAG0_PHANO|nr:hypothetical protein SNOG_11254 [Parastagonospora nodorum SN15]EAT81753.1 hypothetical protein SNOG_11254 [Parastagonospora nodorum SN15]